MNPPPPNGPVPARLRVFGGVVVLAGLVAGYYFLYQPVAEAERTGTLTYYFKGILLSPVFVYLGVVMLFADVRDGQIKQLGPDGKKRLTSKGWSFVVGLIAVMGLTIAGWFLILHQLGFQAM